MSLNQSHKPIYTLRLTRQKPQAICTALNDSSVYHIRSCQPSRISDISIQPMS